MKTSPKTQYVRIKPELPFKPWLLILPTLLVATVNDANALQVNIQNHWMRDYLDMAQNKGFWRFLLRRLIASSFVSIWVQIRHKIESIFLGCYEKCPNEILLTGHL